jgi:hypothetical protein
MPRKPVDPLQKWGQAEVLEPYDWAGVIETSEGLPDVLCVWRPLRIGELTRVGDYRFAGSAWVLAQPGMEVVADRAYRRPLGREACCWYVGARAVGSVGNGSAEWPFEDMVEARTNVPADAIGVFVSTGDYRVLEARDPADWDWERYLETAAVVKTAQVVGDDQLTKLSLAKAVRPVVREIPPQVAAEQ